MDRRKKAEVLRSIRHLGQERRRIVVAYIEDLEKEQAKLQREAYLDDLTGLYRRNAFSRLLKGSLSGALRTDSNLTVAVTDLDEFGKKNKAYGEDAGDAILKDVSGIWADSVRQTDILGREFRGEYGNGVGRLGGEEIVAVIQGISRDDAYRKVDDIRQQTARLSYTFQNLQTGETERVGVTSSSGVAMLDDVGEVRLLYQAPEMVQRRAREEKLSQWVSDYSRKTGIPQEDVERSLNGIVEMFAPYQQYAKFNGQLYELVRDDPLVYGSFIIVKRADSAMVSAKNAGKNRVAVFSR